MLRRLRSRSRAPPPAPSRGKAPRRPAQLAQRPADSGELGALDEAILDVVASAQPPVGRTRAVEILRGGRSKVVVKYAYDGLPAYGTWSHLRADAVLARVDALLQAGTLVSTGGQFPKLEVACHADASPRGSRYPGRRSRAGRLA